MTPSSLDLTHTLIVLEEKHGIEKATSLFIEFLKKKNLFSMGSAIISHLKHKEKRSDVEDTLTITSATPLSSSVVDMIGDLAHQHTGKVPKSLTVKVDKKVVGGFVGVYRGVVLDGSIETLLRKLENKK